MPPLHSFDITSGCDLQEVDNAVNQADKELSQRFDFKGLTFTLKLERGDNRIVIEAPDKHKLAAIWEVLRAKLIRRKQPVRNFTLEDVQSASGGTCRQTITLVQGVGSEPAKKIVKFIKDARLKKVQAAIQGEQVRVSGPSLDDLQDAIARLKSADFGLELNFTNYR